METSFALSSTLTPFNTSKNTIFLPLKSPFFLPSKTPQKPSLKPSISTKISSNFTNNPTKTSINQNPFAKTLQSLSKTLILTLATSLITFKFNETPIKAEPLPPTIEESTLEDQKDENFTQIESGSHQKTPLSHLMNSNPNFVNNLWQLLEKKLELGEDEEALKIVGKLVEAQPNEIEWKFLKARLLSEMGKLQEAREVFEDILALNPLSFEPLFENALLMDRCGEGDGVLVRLERALSIAMDDHKGKEARDVRLIIAQVLFLQKKVDEALRSYEELCKEDPKDFRPYFCKGMIYSLIDRNVEAREEFAKYKELSPREFDVEGYLRTPLSRMKLFETGLRS